MNIPLHHPVRRHPSRNRRLRGSRAWRGMACAAILASALPAAAQTDRIHFNGQDLFLNGLNLAWGEYPGGGASFANDIGPNPSTPNTNHFAGVFDQLSANGGNIMRLWLHTTGANTPAWSGSTVTGPGADTIEDLRALLDLAWDHQVGMMLCLWSFDMLRMSNGGTVTDRAADILTNATYRATYLDAALTPMVTALAGHPAIVAWEVFNEPEGMSDEFGWNFNHHVPMADIQAFINQCAGTIHRADPTARVTNGSWSFDAATDVDGYYNYYTDARLIAAGGDPQGTLDFYCVHYYDWAGAGRSPFLNPAAHWALDKPLVVAEFFPDCANCTATPHESLYRNGYAGALSWSWTDSNHALMLTDIAATAAAHPQDVLLVVPGAPAVAMTSPAHGATFASGASIPMEATASDADGSVAQVVFVQGDTPLSKDTTAPYQFTWPGVPNGLYELTAVATDNEGLSRTSAVVTITVGTPTLIRYEAEEAAYSGNVSIEADAAASGTRYLDMGGNESTDTITWTLPVVPAAGSYPLTFGYRLRYDTPKTQILRVNGGTATSLVFDDADTVNWLEQTRMVALAAGSNQIEIEASWGYMDFDYIDIPVGAPPPSETGTCTVVWANLHQRIDGFGASSAWRRNWTEAQADMFFSTRSGTATARDGSSFAFTGIGLSLLRNRITPDGTTVEIDIMQMAHDRGARVWSAPWSPPASYKDSGTVDGGNFVSSPGNLEGYAALLADYVADIRDSHGIELYALSVQNEPNLSTTYESCEWTPQQLRTFLPYLRTALDTRGSTDTRILLPETSNWDFSPADAALNDPTTADLVDILAAHSYGSIASPVSTRGKALWMTEDSLLVGSDSSIANGLGWAQEIHAFLTEAGANAWHYWWLITANDDGNEGLADTNWMPAKRMYTLGNYSRFVRPGYFRMQADNAGSARISAFRDPITAAFAVVAVNPGGTEIVQTIHLDGIGPDTVTPWITSASHSLSPLPSVSVDASTFTHAIPARSVVTYVGQADPPPPPTITSSVAGGHHAAVLATGPAGPDYTLLLSTNLTQWTSVATTNGATPPVLLVDTNHYPYPLRFYRISVGD